jgi:hypothetical protein
MEDQIRERVAREKYSEMSIKELEILLSESDYVRLGAGQRPFAQAVLDEKIASKEHESEKKEEQRYQHSLAMSKRANWLAIVALIISVLSWLLPRN